MMTIKLNGRDAEVEPGLTVADLLRAKDMRRARAVVALNSRVLGPDRWEGTAIKDGDNVEIFSFVTGG